jgi:hypothetical protein
MRKHVQLKLCTLWTWLWMHLHVMQAVQVSGCGKPALKGPKTQQGYRC